MKLDFISRMAYAFAIGLFLIGCGNTTDEADAPPVDEDPPPERGEDGPED